VFQVSIEPVLAGLHWICHRVCGQCFLQTKLIHDSLSIEFDVVECHGIHCSSREVEFEAHPSHELLGLVDLVARSTGLNHDRRRSFIVVDIGTFEVNCVGLAIVDVGIALSETC